MTPTCLFPCLPWVMYVDLRFPHTHIWGLSFELVKTGGLGWVKQAGAGQGRAGGQRLPVNDSM